MSINKDWVLIEINRKKRPPRFPWGNVIAFVLICPLLGWVLPPQPHVRMVAFILVCIGFVKSLEK